VAQACDQPGDHIAVMQHGRIVEHRPALDLFRSPQHAYTQKLLASAPTMTTDRESPLASLGTQTRWDRLGIGASMHWKSPCVL
jgi:ABC-type dipeptide/oligopeptide/nickel transport system ATPase component